MGDVPGVMESLACGICFEEFDQADRRPMILPKCGHTLCSSCARLIKRGGKIVCCFCRKTSDSDDLVLNFTVMGCVTNRVAADKGMTLPRKPLCPRHNITAQNFCCDCNAWVCRMCWLKACFSSLVRSSHKTNHSMTSIEEFFTPFFQRAAELRTQLDAVRESGLSLEKVLREFHSAIANSTNLSPADYNAILRKFESAGLGMEPNVMEEIAETPVELPVAPASLGAGKLESFVIVVTGFVFYQLVVAFTKSAAESV